MWRAVRRLAAAAVTPPPRGSRSTSTSSTSTTSTSTTSKTTTISKNEEVIPDVLVSFGNQADKITFVSHPGVMAVSKLIEMGHIAQYRAVLTQENVDDIAKYDQDLARKAQIAVDEGLAVNFQDLEYFDNPEFVAAFKKEKEILKKIREEVMALPKGKYTMPKALEEYQLPMAPRSMRPETAVPPEVFEMDRRLEIQEELNDAVDKHFQEKDSKKQLKE